MAVLATDDFNRANSSGSLGANWTSVPGFGSLSVLSNKANTAGSEFGNYYSATAFPNDQYSKAQMFTTGTSAGTVGPGLLVRQSSSIDQAYWGLADLAATSNVCLFKIV